MNRNWGVAALIALSLMSVLPAIKMSQAQEDPNNPITIFISGQKYQSVQEYKRQRLEGFVRDAVKGSALQDLDAFSEELRKDLIADNLQGIGLNTLDDVLLELNKRSAGKQDVDEIKTALNSDQLPDEIKKILRESDTRELEQMLEEYNQKQTDGEPIKIESSKMKTIILQPKSNN
jgi:hypothetical protein